MSFADDLEARLYGLALGRASRRARSTREWIAKVGLVLEELEEAEHWLSLIADAGLGAPPQNLLNDCRALRAIPAKSAATARKRYSGRWKPPRSNPPTH